MRNFAGFGSLQGFGLRVNAMPTKGPLLLASRSARLRIPQILYYMLVLPEGSVGWVQVIVNDPKR